MKRSVPLAAAVAAALALTLAACSPATETPTPLPAVTMTPKASETPTPTSTTPAAPAVIDYEAVITDALTGMALTGSDSFGNSYTAMLAPDGSVDFLDLNGSPSDNPADVWAVKAGVVTLTLSGFPVASTATGESFEDVVWVLDADKLAAAASEADTEAVTVAVAEAFVTEPHTFSTALADGTEATLTVTADQVFGADEQTEG